MVWVYTIDWRSRAVEVVAELPPGEVDVFIAGFVSSLPKDRLEDFNRYCTLGTTVVGDDLLATAEQWKRHNGKVSYVGYSGCDGHASDDGGSKA